MKLATNFLLKNWSAVLLFAVLTGGWAWVKGKDRKIEELNTVLDSARTDNDNLKQNVKRLGLVLDSARTDNERLVRLLDSARSDRRADSVFCAEQVTKLQGVVNVLHTTRKKLQTENDYLRMNPVRVDLIETRTNIFGKIKDSTYTEGYKWVKD